MKTIVLGLSVALLSTLVPLEARAGFWDDLTTVFGGPAVLVGKALYARQTPSRNVAAKREQDLRAAVTFNLNAAAQYCLAHDISKLSCDTMPARDDDSRAAGTLEQAGYKIFQLGVSDDSSILLGPGAILINRIAALDSGLDAQRDQARKELASISKEFGGVVRGERLDTCHSACLIQCFTSKALHYDDPASENAWDFMTEPADLGPDAAAGTGAGICRNYSDLASDVNRRMGGAGGLQPVLMKSIEHVMVGYYDGGHAYLLEPQSDPFSTGHCGRYVW